MKRKYILIAVFFAVVAFVFIHIKNRASFYSYKHNGAPGGAIALITEPDNGIAPVLAMIARATKSVDLVMYELDDAQIEAALAAAEQRGVAIRVILSSGYKGASSTMNMPAYNFLLAHGVSVRWSLGYFSLTHQKSLVVDGDRALIMTFNLVSKYYSTGRDFGIVDSDPRDVAAIVRTFGDDWSGGIAPQGGNDGEAGDDLLWSPGAKPALIDLIAGAKRSLSIYNEEMADPAITKALIDAARRGVAVYVDMTGASEWKWEFAELATAGVHVRTYADDADAPLYIHAKMIVADGGTTDVRAFVGSENFSAGSLDDNRELGIIMGDPRIITGLMRIFAADWRAATPFTP